MERIEEAIRKAKTSPKTAREASDRRRNDLATAFAPSKSSMIGMARPWDVPRVRLDPAHLERQRIVSYAKTDQNHVAFNIMRTRLNQALTENSWCTVGITSPTPECGKTTVAVNLAFALARQADCTTILIDLDIGHTSISKALGTKSERSIGQYLQGEADLDQCFVRADDNLFVGLNNTPVGNFSEMAENQRAKSMLPTVIDALSPKIVIVDLPPILSGDEVIAYAPQVDTTVLIAAAGQTTTREIDECNRQIGAASNLLGVVLNKCQETPHDTYQYGAE